MASTGKKIKLNKESENTEEHHEARFFDKVQMEEKIFGKYGRDEEMRNERLINDIVVLQTDIEVYKGSNNSLTRLETLSDQLSGKELERHKKYLKKLNLEEEEDIQSPVYRIYGNLANSTNVILAHVHGFFPYLYVATPKQFDEEKHLEFFQWSLNKAIDNDNRDKSKIYIVHCKMVEKQNIYYYHSNDNCSFIQIFTINTQYLASAKRLLERGEVKFLTGNSLTTTSENFQIYESNIPFEIRFMVDTDIVGCNWITFEKDKYQERLSGSRPSKQSTCTYEIDVNWRDIISHSPTDDDWMHFCSLRILSFDIECSNRPGIFPDPKIDQVIQIAAIVQIQSSTLEKTEPFVKCVFALRDVAPIAGADVYCFRSEKELLLKFAQFVRAIDPDIITGYNIQNFDFPYLFDRAKTLNIPHFNYLGRLKDNRATEKPSVLQSKQLGKRENHDVFIDGRVIFDVLLVLLREHKLRSYSLNAVSYHFLKEQKEDVHHSIITTLQNGNSITRRRLAVYCLKDALLPLRLINKLLLIVNHIEMARVTGVPISALLLRGQQIKVLSQLLRKTKEKNYILPTMKVDSSNDAVQFEGATVIDPVKGFYQTPIATLDFSSLYPSIMIAHNLCYTTLIRNKNTKDLPSISLENDCTVTPSGDVFVKSKVKAGLLPEILEALLSARKKAKKLMKECEANDYRRIVYDGRQLALKISANSVYGFTGAVVGKLPCLEISQSVTSFGREMIEETKLQVEKEYVQNNNYLENAQVIYGDTDSVMVKFLSPSNVDEALQKYSLKWQTEEERKMQLIRLIMKWGKEAADSISNKFKKPIRLEFEKIYFPYILINKKRYAGLYWTNEHHYDKMDCKGIETVRRDNCSLVAKLIGMCLHKLLIENAPAKAIMYVKSIIQQLLLNEIDISQLIITKELSKESYSARQCHVELVNKLKQRAAKKDSEVHIPQLGDRIPYVITAGSNKQAAYEKAEDPDYVLENSIPIDTKYYIEQQLTKPLLRLFEPILGSESKAKSELFYGNHTLSKIRTSSKIGALASFAKKRVTCIGCRAPLSTITNNNNNNNNDNNNNNNNNNIKNSGNNNPFNFMMGNKLKEEKMEVKEEKVEDIEDIPDALCSYCMKYEDRIYQRELAHFNNLQQKFTKLWTQCQRCQESLTQDVICTSRDCPIFYMRSKIQQDVREQAKTIERFNNRYHKLLNWD
ncbi:hypothetical protein SNEBB_003236 [Seison nebaliae]|nr:hypothetical protein SNEBB_003236 [Seison nebaliae]